MGLRSPSDGLKRLIEMFKSYTVLLIFHWPNVLLTERGLKFFITLKNGYKHMYFVAIFLMRTSLRLLYSSGELFLLPIC